MQYTKPVVINSETVRSAVCGSGPCGKPCSKRAWFYVANDEIRTQFSASFYIILRNMKGLACCMLTF